MTAALKYANDPEGTLRVKAQSLAGPHYNRRPQEVLQFSRTPGFGEAAKAWLRRATGPHCDAGGNWCTNGRCTSADGIKSSQRQDRCHTAIERVRGTGIVSAFEDDRPCRQGKRPTVLRDAAQNRTGHPFQSGECASSACAPSVLASPFERARCAWAARI